MILTIIFGILGFSIMVFIHELGHFIAAKRVGIHVEAFSLGWGKKILGFMYKGTSYRISMLPFGGYCKMKGEIPQTDDENPQPDSFFAASPWKRIIVAVAGPTANIIFAVIVLTIIWWAGFKIYSDDNRIVLAMDYELDQVGSMSPAAKANLETGDRIIEINGKPIENFQDILETVAPAPNKQLEFLILRQDRKLSLIIVPELDLDTGMGRIGVYAWRDPIIDKVANGSSAHIAGLKKGDRIKKLDGKPINHTIDLYQILARSPAKIEAAIIRDGAEVTLPIIMSYDEKGNPNLGISFEIGIIDSPSINFPEAFLKGMEEMVKTLSLTVKGIGLLFKGVNLRNVVGGPLRIAYYAGSVATSGFSIGISEGLTSYFRFLSLFSIVLFLINLLPIPATDGGQILLFLIEIVRRKRINPRIIARIQAVSFSFLIVLALFITFNDVLFFIGR